jgi:hypothetical protein
MATILSFLFVIKAGVIFVLNAAATTFPNTVPCGKEAEHIGVESAPTVLSVQWQ